MLSKGDSGTRKRHPSDAAAEAAAGADSEADEDEGADRSSEDGCSETEGVPMLPVGYALPPWLRRPKTESKRGRADAGSRSTCSRGRGAGGERGGLTDESDDGGEEEDKAEPPPKSQKRRPRGKRGGAKNKKKREGT